MSLKKIDPEKTKRFLKNSAIAIAVAVALSYLWFSFSGVFGRSSESVANTEWMSWDVGTLRFGSSTVVYVTSDSVASYTFDEKGGTVVLSDFAGEKAMSLTRFGSNKMVTGDGRSTFYLKGSTLGGRSDESQADR